MKISIVDNMPQEELGEFDFPGYELFISFVCGVFAAGLVSTVYKGLALGGRTDQITAMVFTFVLMFAVVFLAMIYPRDITSVKRKRS